LKGCLNHYFQDLFEPTSIATLAAYFHPHFRDLHHVTSDRQDETRDALLSLIVRCTGEEDADDVREMVKLQMSKYETTNIDEALGPTEFWMDKCDNIFTGMLVGAARAMLSFPATSSSAERLFFVRKLYSVETPRQLKLR
jgi:hypothetical protein